jgi:hypothetical protein
MSDTTTVRIHRSTREDPRRLADERHITVAEAVARGVRLLRQEQMGQQLTAPLTDDERAGWMQTSGDVVEVDLGNVGPVILAQIRGTLSALFDV